MVRNKIIFLFLAISTHAFGQGRNGIWCFGDSAGIDFNIPSNPITFQSGMSPRGSCVTISDSSGQLLFYAGVNDNAGYLAGKLKAGMVYNRDHNLMINGDSLIGGAWYHEMVIIPEPANSNSFYLFHIGVTHDYGLYYSIIDMIQDNGLGALVSKNNQLDTLAAFDCLQAIKHGNGRDWWLIYKQWQTGNNYFYKYLITPAGVQLNSIDSVGVIATSGGGDLVFNSDGSRFAFCDWLGLLALYNFDRCTGQISPFDTIEQEDQNGNYPYFMSCSFSGNDSVLYVSSIPYYSSLNANDIYLYQYNLAAPNILNSKKTIQQFHYPVVPGGLKLAPDHKIYLSSDIDIYPYDSTNYQPEIMNLSVINEPNKLDTACHFQPFTFYLGGKRTYWGLPNNPNYDLGPVVNSVCDSLFNSVEQISKDQTGIAIYPNPTTGIITLNRIFFDYSKCTFDVFDLDGKHCYSSVLDVTMNPIQKDLSMLKNGVYFLRVQCDGIDFKNMKLIIIK
jgi:hypothetical protein